MGSTSILRVQAVGSRYPYALRLVPTVTVQRSDIGDKPAMDVALSTTTSGVGFVVNGAGGVYKCSAQEDRAVV